MTETARAARAWTICSRRLTTAAIKTLVSAMWANAFTRTPAWTRPHGEMSPSSSRLETHCDLIPRKSRSTPASANHAIPTAEAIATSIANA